MRHLWTMLVVFITFISCKNTAHIKNEKVEVALIPAPKNMSLGDKALVLDRKSSLYSPNASLNPMLSLFSGELLTLTGFELLISDGNNAPIQFEIDTMLHSNEYKINIQNDIHVTAGSPQAAIISRTTLLQMAKVDGEYLLFPQGTISDRPDAAYRGLMIDLARKWHTLESIKKLIDLASYYKTNYVQLHFTDDQSYTLPSKKYPKLSTPERHYTFEQLEELEAYSQARGVTIIPEIDVPGHAKSLVTAYPELFGIAAHDENPYILNMGKEEVYSALDDIFGEILPIFKSTPYFHIGGDEARFTKVMEDPDVKAYIATHHLEEDVHEVYRHFLVRMNEIVKKHGKQTFIWEGFAKDGKIEIPKDMVVFEFESLYHLPNKLIEDGYKVVNTSWKPLYVVNEKKWAPKTIYDWNMWQFGNWWSRSPATASPIQLEETPLVIGAQMCTWEQPQEVEFKSLRKRLPVMNERIWNTKNTISYDEFMKHLESTDAKLSLLVNDAEQDSLLVGYNHKEANLSQ